MSDSLPSHSPFLSKYSWYLKSHKNGRILKLVVSRCFNLSYTFYTLQTALKMYNYYLQKVYGWGITKINLNYGVNFFGRKRLVVHEIDSIFRDQLCCNIYVGVNEVFLYPLVSTSLNYVFSQK